MRRKEKKPPFDSDLEFILIAAVRYAVGRETYAPELVQRWIMAHPETLSENGIEVMIRDIDDKDHIRQIGDLTYDGLGSTTIDRPGWLHFRGWLMDLKKERQNGK